MTNLTIFRKRELAKPNSLVDFIVAKAATVPPERARLVLAFDATASRECPWALSTELTVALLSAMPGHLQVALAVHGGSELHTFTSFYKEAHKLRRIIAGISCRAGATCLLPILDRVGRMGDVSIVCYIGDSFEESERQARKSADRLKAAGTRVIILDDNPPPAGHCVPIFLEVANRTGGCVLPFDAAAVPKMRELLAAVAVLAVGDVPLLEVKKDQLPAARLLLERVKR